jgi:tetratricopeptide (TPR) repeat protein
MKLTIEQVLQKGISAHNEGNLKEAERLYQAILQSKPLHPDANHNLGVIAVSVNKAKVALPLFKTALEANPKIEQFWLSYIDALIKEKQLENAKQIIQQAKNKEIKGDKLDILGVRLNSLITAESIDNLSPSQEQLSILLEHYQSGRFNDAESLALSITQEFPKHQFGWKVLGALLKQTGRLSESLVANQKSIQLASYDPEAFSNLGIVLKELGRLDEAEASYAQAIALKPNYPEAHFNLGNTLEGFDRLDEAEASYAQAIALKPDYAEAFSNLGNVLKELGRLDEAEASYAQAIALKPNYAVTHNNLGIVLKELGRLDEALISLRCAITLNPNNAEANYNLGNTLKELGKLDEAEASYKQAIILKPNYSMAYLNLGSTLKDLGRLDEAETVLRQAIAIKPNDPSAIHNLSTVQSYMNNLEEEIDSLQNILQIDFDDYGLRAGVNLAICNFLKDDFADSKKFLLDASQIEDKISLKFENEKVYQRYLLNILSWHEEKYFNVSNQKTDRNLYVIGESHSLVSHQLHIQSSGSNVLCRAKLIKGCKQWHLGNSFKNQYKNKFETIFSSLPKFSEVLLTIGEIDCRLDSGIIKHKNKFPEIKLEEIILTTVENYLTYIVKNNSDCQHNIIIQGVPCPNINKENFPEKDVSKLIEVISIFNFELQTKSKEKGFRFLDVHKLTDRGDGFSNDLWHIDRTHLSPDGFLEAWSRYLTN